MSRSYLTSSIVFTGVVLVAALLPEAASAFGLPPGGPPGLGGGGGGGGGGGAGGAPLPLLGATLLGKAGLVAGGYVLWRKRRGSRG